mgnify:CR=1 FL=1
MIDWGSLKKNDTYTVEDEDGNTVEYLVIDVRDGIIISKSILN